MTPPSPPPSPPTPPARAPDPELAHARRLSGFLLALATHPILGDSTCPFDTAPLVRAAHVLERLVERLERGERVLGAAERDTRRLDALERACATVRVPVEGQPPDDQETPWRWEVAAQPWFRVRTEPLRVAIDRWLATAPPERPLPERTPGSVGRAWDAAAG